MKNLHRIKTYVPAVYRAWCDFFPRTSFVLKNNQLYVGDHTLCNMESIELDTDRLARRYPIAFRNESYIPKNLKIL